MPIIKDITAAIEQVAPPALAQDWDNVGLLVGDPNAQVTDVLLTLDITEAVVREAVDKGAGLIISHHPLLFNPVKTITTHDEIGRMLLTLIKNNIAVYAAHTNIDVAKGGINDALAKMIGLKDVMPLEITHNEELKKLVVYVPKGNDEKVKAAIFSAGAGHIGNYSHCSFISEGIGTFLPGEAAKPYIGTRNKLESTEEYRLETIVPADKCSAVIKALLNAHPYEEVAYDIYPMELKGKMDGIGRVGRLPVAITLTQLAHRVKALLKMDNIKVVGDPQALIRDVALCSGGGSDFISEQTAKMAQVYITGDIKHSNACKARGIGLNLIVVGHFESEVIVKDIFKEIINSTNFDKINTHISQNDVNVFVEI